VRWWCTTVEVKGAEDRRAGSWKTETGNSRWLSVLRDVLSSHSPAIAARSAVCWLRDGGFGDNVRTGNVGNPLWRSTPSVDRMAPPEVRGRLQPLARSLNVTQGHTGAECGGPALCSCNGEEKVRADYRVCGCPSTDIQSIAHRKRAWGAEAFMSRTPSQPFLGLPQKLCCARARRPHSPGGCCTSTLQARRHWREGSINEWGPATVAKGGGCCTVYCSHRAEIPLKPG
jgi:hypothetical protein